MCTRDNGIEMEREKEKELRSGGMEASTQGSGRMILLQEREG